jgi:acyl-CoA hydrolase
MSAWTARAVTPDEAVSGVASGMNIFVHGAAATPTLLLEALARRRDRMPRTHGNTLVPFSRVVPAVKAGAGVVTTRGHVQWVVTEPGAVNLFGKSLRERAELLISVAHPDARGDLRRAFADTRHVILRGLTDLRSSCGHFTTYELFRGSWRKNPCRRPSGHRTAALSSAWRGPGIGTPDAPFLRKTEGPWPCELGVEA